MSRSFSQRWNRVRSEIALQDLMLDVSGKVLVALGLGAIFAGHIKPYAGVAIFLGLALSVIVKAKYWKRFWA
jgi:hypothetical protein